MKVISDIILFQGTRRAFSGHVWSSYLWFLWHHMWSEMSELSQNNLKDVLMFEKHQEQRWDLLEELHEWMHQYIIYKTNEFSFIISDI